MKQNLHEHVKHWFPSTLKALHASRTYILGVIIGTIAGLGAIVFNFLVFGSLDIFYSILLQWQVENVSPDAVVLVPAEGLRYWLMPLVVAFGGLVSGLLVYTFAPEAEGHGTDGYIKAFHRNRGEIRPQVPIVKTIASAITIGSGGSAGREGPIAQIGAGFGSYLGQLLKLDVGQRRALIIAGTAGGVGAVFCAPLGGAIFAIEVLYRKQDMETEHMIPAILSSLVAFTIFSTLTGQTQVFHTPTFEFSIYELLPYALMGLVCALIGVLYVVTLYGVRDHFFRRLPIKPHFVPMVGGLMVGLLALLQPEILSGGYGWIERSLNENLDLSFMVGLVFAKLIATTFTISAGGSGGVFGPSLFIGAMLGGAFGFAFDLTFPGWINDPRSFALVGMVAFFSGIAKVPIASLLMICEMSQSYELLPPMMLVSSITYILTDRWSLYEEQVMTKSDSPVHLGEYRTDVLAGLQVREAIRRDHISFPQGASLRAMLPRIIDSGQSVFPVTGKGGDVIGMLFMSEVRDLMLEPHMHDLIVAHDIVDPEYPSVTMQEDLHSVMRTMTELDLDEIPVMQVEGNRFEGVVHRRDIVNLYSKRLYSIQNEL